MPDASPYRLILVINGRRDSQPREDATRTFAPAWHTQRHEFIIQVLRQRQDLEISTDELFQFWRTICRNGKGAKGSRHFDIHVLVLIHDSQGMLPKRLTQSIRCPKLLPAIFHLRSPDPGFLIQNIRTRIRRQLNIQFVEMRQYRSEVEVVCKGQDGCV